MTKINDFVIRFANVNGTGSASANALFTRSVFRMGVPVTPKNIFPSNIQGLPTWYEVRVSEKGNLGRRDGVDLAVAVNPQSMKKDYADVMPGGYFVYDSSKPLPPGYDREDIEHIAIPLMELANAEFTEARQRQLFKNIIYIGALVTLFKIEFPVIEQLIGEQFRGKEKLIAPNIKALKIGEQWVLDNLKAESFTLSVERRDLLQGKILYNGNSACALGAIYGGATVAAWYPITPSTSVVDAFAKYAGKYRVDPDSGKNNYAIVQAEDELAAIGMVMGASWNGARSFTATSGPGVSLMSEFLGLGYFAEIPSVLIDVQRTGPSTGMPTRTQQSDLLSTAYASHGDTKHPLLLPATPKECFEMTAMAFDLAERLQTPVIIVTDLDLGMNDHITDQLAWDDSKVYDCGKVLSAVQLDAIYGTANTNGGSAEDLDSGHLAGFKGRFGRYLDVDGDGIPFRTIPGTHVTRGAFTTRGSSRDEYAIYTEDGAAYKRNVDRLALKFETAKDLVPQPEFIAAGQRNAGFDVSKSSKDGIIYFGTSTYAAMEAMEMFQADGIKIDAMRPRAFPFGEAFSEFVAAHDRIFVVEQNRDAQFRSLILIELGADPTKLISVLNYDGTPITADNIYGQIKTVMT
ncbi:MAG: 2-oxoacid:acceptor oxidoreductase subunit alpha [Acidobacteria bacterium]|nr:2-oxoacid:acceptor oxidoreductase subunit alpha [Acidobacteriota bacterium]